MLTNPIKKFFKAASYTSAMLFVFSFEAQSLDVLRTKVIDGFYIRITGTSFTTTNTPIDDKLSFCICRTTTNNDARVYMPTAHEYIYKIELFDTNGVEVPKTKLGKDVGTKFFALEPIFNPYKGYKLAIETTVNEGSGWCYLFFPYRPGYGGQPFYSPNDLFDVSRPGRYTLEICFQFIVRTGVGAGEAAHIVRFPPLDYLLIKIN
jgi:hypothetical protein